MCSRSATGASAPQGGDGMYRIMIAEDDVTIATLLRDHLIRFGYDAFVCDDLRDVKGVFLREQPHLLLLDIGLPFFSGCHWCQEIRRVSTAPIVFISSNAAPMDMVIAMNMGGDDYLCKPFDLSVVMAKIGALLRRTYDFTGVAQLLEHRGAVLDAAAGTLKLPSGKVLTLTRNENRILQMLIEHKGVIISRDMLMQQLWDSDCFIDDNTLTVNVGRLRKKLEEHGLAGFITTRKGQGYLVACDPGEQET